MSEDTRHWSARRAYGRSWVDRQRPLIYENELRKHKPTNEYLQSTDQTIDRAARLWRTWVERCDGNHEAALGFLLMAIVEHGLLATEDDGPSRWAI